MSTLSHPDGVAAENAYAGACGTTGRTSMSLKLEDAKAELIERAAAVARDRVSGEQATSLSTFIQRYYAQVAPEDLLEIDVYDLYGAAVAHWNLARDRTPGTTVVRVYTPQFAQ